MSIDEPSVRTGAMLVCPSCGTEHEVVIVTGQAVAVPVDDEPEAFDDEPPQPDDDEDREDVSSVPMAQEDAWVSEARKSLRAPFAPGAPAPRPYRTSTSTGARRPEPKAPPAFPVLRGLGRWRCGHDFTVPATIDQHHPERVPCPLCGVRGLLSQRTPQGIAPVLARP